MSAAAHRDDGKQGAVGAALGDALPVALGHRTRTWGTSGLGADTGSGGVLGQALDMAARGVAAADEAITDLFRDSVTQLTATLEQVDTLRAGLERVTVAITLEAAGRGAHLDAELSLHDWVAGRCRWLSRGEIGDLVVVVTELDHPAHGPIGAAVADGVLPARRAARLLRCLRQIRPVTDPDTYEQCISILLPVATDTGYTDAELKKVTDHLLGLALSDAAHESRAKTARELRGVHESSLADGSLTRFVVTADAEGAALVRAILNSPLAAPAPDEDGPDLRTPTQRRYDALITVLGRGVTSPEGTPTTSKARIIVTMPFDVLKQQLLGLGHTGTGETLSPATVRRLACTAEIIPAVLGGHSQILDLGRAARLASPAQHLVLWRRDMHCTYPGCTVPPQWCSAHHLDWWSRGGRTDISRLVLLCDRHHTVVHQRDLTATVDETGVTWHRP